MSLADAEDHLADQEAALVAEIAAGNIDEPMRELHRRYARRLFRFGMQVLGNPGLAEEMVQESFMRLWRTAGSFDSGRGSVGAYLTVIARSVAYDIRKRPSSRPLVAVEEVALPPSWDDTDQILDSLIVREALGKLSADHAQVLILAQDEGLTQTQIAARLGVPLGTVKSRMFHGMRALRAELTGRGIHAA